MGQLPASGQKISFGKVNKAYTNFDPGSPGNAPAGGRNVKLSAVLGSNLSISTGTTISFSASFGGEITDYDYPT